jgi:LAO/AO transport system kinase
MGDAARRAAADLSGALTLFAARESFATPVVLVAAATGSGIEELDQAIVRHREWLAQGDRLHRRRERQEEAWVEEAIRARFGSAGLTAARGIAMPAAGPFTRERVVARALGARLGIQPDA